MECNKDEAMKAKTIAEKKFADRDFAGAKRFILKARTLNPGLDGVSHMLITLDVYICYEKKINGESDWYGILDANPSDDDETIKKQYKKLALMLHPDKNKSVGADDTFKILSEAWALLSEKSKRSAYNQRRNPSGFQQNVSPKKECPSADAGVNRTHPHTATKATSNPKSSNSTNSTSASKTGPAPRPHQAHTPAPAPPLPPLDQGIYLFWTSCYQCKMSFQYHKMHVNKTILCCNCHMPFLAAEMPVPMNYTIPTSHATSSYYNINTGTIPPTHPTGWAPSGPGSYYYSNMNIPNAPFPAAPMLPSRNLTTPTAQATGSAWVPGPGSYHNTNIDASDGLKRMCDDNYAQGVSKRRREEDGGQSSNVYNVNNLYNFSPGSYSFSPGSY